MLIELTVPVGTLGLVETASLPAGTSVEFERVASGDPQAAPTLVVSGPDATAVADAIATSATIEGVTTLGGVTDGVCCRLQWRDSGPRLIEDVVATGGTILSAAAAGNTWTLEIRYPDRDAAATFYERYDDPAHPVTIERIYPDAVVRQPVGTDMTRGQRDALVRALDAGYFEVPRRTTLVDLARDLDISDTALSQRLRRGLANVLHDVTDPARPVATSDSRLE